MKIAIINHFSQKTVTYERILKNKQVEFIVFTKNTYKDFFAGKGIKTYGYDDFDNNVNVFVDVISEHKLKPFDAIIAPHEFDVEKAGKLREYLNIEGQDYLSSLQFRDKYLMKKAVSSNVKTPKYKKIEHSIDLFEFISLVGYPVVVKPRMGAGSENVVIIKNEVQLMEFLENYDNSSLLAESFIDGEMYHVDGLYKKDEFFFSQPSKYINTCLSFIDNIAIGSYQLDSKNFLFERLNKQTKLVLDCLKTPKYVIPFHAEFFVTNSNELIFCEIGCRVGGGMINEATLNSHSIDLTYEGIYGQLGIDRDIKPNFKQYYSGWVMIPPKVGTLKSLEIKEEPWITDYKFNHEDLNKTFSGGHSSASKIISYAVIGNSEEDVQNKISELITWQDENTEWIN